MHVVTRQKPLRPAVMGTPPRPPSVPNQYDHGMASSHDIMQRMKAIQAAREEAIQPLLAVLAERQELERKLAELDEPFGISFSQAEAGGWTVEELRELGAEVPAKRPKGRPRGARRTAKKETPRKASGTSASEPAAAAIPEQEGSGQAATAAAGSISG